MINSSFVNISSQHGPLCLILLHLSILKLSYWQSKYDEMHLSIKNAAPTTIGAAKWQSTVNLMYHRCFAQCLQLTEWLPLKATCPGTCHPGRENFYSRGVVQQVGHW